MIEYMNKELAQVPQERSILSGQSQVQSNRGLPVNTMYSSHHQPVQLRQIQQNIINNCSINDTNELTSNHVAQNAGQTDELIGYYFGSISRDTAEWIIRNHGNNMDGAYLLRSSGPKDDFVLSLAICSQSPGDTQIITATNQHNPGHLEILHYKIVETEDSYVALHGQVGDEKFATIDELIDKAQGVATKPKWPIYRHKLESQILPPTFWGLSVDQIRLAILIKAKQWGFPLLTSLFQSQDCNISIPSQPQQQQNQGFTILDGLPNLNDIPTLSNETIRTLIYKSLHEFQPWFHGRISRDEAEQRIESGLHRDGKFLVRERDNYSYAICISHKKTTKHYRIDVLSTGELAIQDGKKFTSLMALVSHYTIMSDGLWCALTEACARPINSRSNLINSNTLQMISPTLHSNINLQQLGLKYQVGAQGGQGFYFPSNPVGTGCRAPNMIPPPPTNSLPSDGPAQGATVPKGTNKLLGARSTSQSGFICPAQSSAVTTLKAPIREWLQSINHKWSQLIGSRNHHQSLNSFLFGCQNPLNNHCRHIDRNRHSHHHEYHDYQNQKRRCKNGHSSCGCIQQMQSQLHSSKLPIEARTSNYIHHDGFPSMRATGFCDATSRGSQRQRGHPDDASLMVNGLSCCAERNSMGRDQLAKASEMDSSRSIDQRQPNLINSSNSLLSNLPQNSGFTLCSQSFIGSPLFAVRQQLQPKHPSMAILNRPDGQGVKSSTTDTTRHEPKVGEEKLISPAQSISANLNNPYSLTTDIYGSQTSTAIINDRLPTSSSSSSGTNNRASISSVIEHLRYGAGGQSLQAASGNASKQNQNYGKAYGKQIHSGQLNCANQREGHIGNYRDRTSRDFCSQRSCLFHRASDDSQLFNTATSQLVVPAAMSKFVQFQDGQCLRTHRDTRSIQLAYLQSRQVAANGKGLANLTRNHHHELMQDFSLKLQGQNNGRANVNGSLSSGSCDQSNMSYMNGNSHSSAVFADGSASNLQHQIQGLRPSQDQANTTNNCDNNCGIRGPVKDLSTNGQAESSLLKEADLMDCGDDALEGFKYDPRLIKSSSIETLCGVDADEVEQDPNNFKSNTELMMSLQTCWLQPSQMQNSMLQSNPQVLEGIGNDLVRQTEFEQNGSLLYSSNQNNGFGDLISLEQNHDEREMNAYELHSAEKKQDLDELTTALLAELTASLKAQVDLKNKRSGLGGLMEQEKPNGNVQQTQVIHRDSTLVDHHEFGVPQTNTRDLINEFDTLVPARQR